MRAAGKSELEVFRISVAPPSASTSPSRSWSYGREAFCGASSRFVSAPSMQKESKMGGNMGVSQAPASAIFALLVAIRDDATWIASIPVQQLEETERAGPFMPNSIER